MDYSSKTSIPTLTDGYIQRPQLMDRYDQLIQSGITQIHAPAGYGKSTSLIQWINSRKHPAAWLTLDHSDKDPASFWRSLEASFRQSQQLPSFLILDNIDPFLHPTVIELLRQNLCEQMSSNLRIILTGRRNISPYVSVNQNITVPLLRFDQQEISDLFQKNHLFLTDTQLESLEIHTDGWPKIVRLMLLSFLQQPDTFSIAGWFRNPPVQAGHFFEEEILCHLSENIRELLLKTAQLETLSIPLCTTVNGGYNCHMQLESLLQDYSLIFRHHQQKNRYKCRRPLAFYLRHKMKTERQNELQQLYYTVAQYYEKERMHEKAIHYYFHAKNYSAAARLIENTAPGIISSGKDYSQLRRWLNHIPKRRIHNKKELWLASAWLYLVTGEGHIPETRFDTSACPEFFLFQLNMALSHHQFPLAVESLKHLSSTKADTIHYPVIHRDLLDAASSGLLTESVGFFGNLNALYPKGQLIYAPLSEFCSELIPVFQLLEAEILYEKNQLSEASGLLIKGMKRLEELGNWTCYIAAAQLFCRITRHQGTQRNFLDTLQYLETLLPFSSQPEKQHLAGMQEKVNALKLRFFIEMGNASEAAALLEDLDWKLCQYPTHQTITQQLLHARLLIQAGSQISAGIKLDQIEAYLMNTFRPLHQTEFFILKSLHQAFMEEMGTASKTMIRALETGILQGYCRIFLDYGLLLYPMIQRAQKIHLPAGDEDKMWKQYTSSILKSLQTEGRKPVFHKNFNGTIEPLTLREREVLSCICQSMSNQEIADKLCISVSTVKVHNRNIFEKLMVSNRTQAIDKTNKNGYIC